MICFTYCRATPDEVGIEQIAAALKKLNIHGLLIIGGFEVHFVHFINKCNYLFHVMYDVMCSVDILQFSCSVGWMAWRASGL